MNCYLISKQHDEFDTPEDWPDVYFGALVAFRGLRRRDKHDPLIVGPGFGKEGPRQACLFPLTLEQVADMKPGDTIHVGNYMVHCAGVRHALSEQD